MFTFHFINAGGWGRGGKVVVLTLPYGECKIEGWLAGVLLVTWNFSTTVTWGKVLLILNVIVRVSLMKKLAANIDPVSEWEPTPPPLTLIHSTHALFTSTSSFKEEHLQLNRDKKFTRRGLYNTKKCEWEINKWTGWVK